MVHLAMRLEWITKDPFMNYTPRIEKVNREHLSDTELAKLESKVFEIARIDMIRDLFVFCCYTGLTYVVVINLPHDNIVDTSDCTVRVSTNSKKTDPPLTTKLL